MNQNFKEKFANFPEVEPDEFDLEMISNINERREKGTEEFLPFDLTAALREAETEYSGKVNLRIPKSLHGDLSHEAKRQGVSLNQYISYVLASRPR